MSDQATRRRAIRRSHCASGGTIVDGTCHDECAADRVSAAIVADQAADVALNTITALRDGSACHIADSQTGDDRAIITADQATHTTLTIHCCLGRCRADRSADILPDQPASIGDIVSAGAIGPRKQCSGDTTGDKRIGNGANGVRRRSATRLLYVTAVSCQATDISFTADRHVCQHIVNGAIVGANQPSDVLRGTGSRHTAGQGKIADHAGGYFDQPVGEMCIIADRHAGNTMAQTIQRA